MALPWIIGAAVASVAGYAIKKLTEDDESKPQSYSAEKELDKYKQEKTEELREQCIEFFDKNVDEIRDELENSLHEILDINFLSYECKYKLNRGGWSSGWFCGAASIFDNSPSSKIENIVCNSLGSLDATTKENLIQMSRYFDIDIETTEELREKLIKIEELSADVLKLSKLESKLNRANKALIK